MLAPPLWAVLQFGTAAGGGLASSEPRGGAGGAAVALLVLIGFLAASYGKDAGKFFLVAQARRRVLAVSLLSFFVRATRPRRATVLITIAAGRPGV